MSELGIRSASGRAREPRITVPAAVGSRPSDLLERDFTASAPNTRWVADITYVDRFSGFACTAFITDLYSRAIVGWQVADNLRADLALDAPEMAVFARKAGSARIWSIIPTGACNIPPFIAPSSGWKTSRRSAPSEARATLMITLPRNRSACNRRQPRNKCSGTIMKDSAPSFVASNESGAPQSPSSTTITAAVTASSTASTGPPPDRPEGRRGVWLRRCRQGLRQRAARPGRTGGGDRSRPDLTAASSAPATWRR